MKALERIYAVPTFLLPSKIESLVDGTSLETLRELFDTYLQHRPTSQEHLRISKTVARQLAFHVPLQGVAGSWTRLSYAGNPLHQAKCCKDCVAQVRCPVCAETYFYRLSVLEGVEGLMDLYRIPKLEYASTLRNGVGILVHENEIVGRMIYGTPACRCQGPKRAVNIC